MDDAKLNTWLSRVANADNEGHVIRIAREFIESWSSLDISRLPTNCRPRSLVTPRDVSGYPQKLSMEICEDGAPLQRMVVFFKEATDRPSTF